MTAPREAPAAAADGDDEHTLRVTLARAAPAAAAVFDDRVHCLVVARGDDPGRRVALGAQPLRCGRRPGCDFVLADPEVSALHCELRTDPQTGVVEVTDLGSTNGTFVDGRRIAGTAALPEGALLQLGRQVLRHEVRPRSELERADDLERDLDAARRHLMSLLPPPLRSGAPRVDWLYRPSARLGGDGFGYFRLGGGRLAGFLLDVSGHGVAAAVHAVSVLNVMRGQALPGVDFADPAQVLAGLNTMFPMEAHGGLLFTLWYGVYDPATRRLDYASAGHHPACLVDGSRRGARPLATRNPVLGAVDGARFVAASTVVPPGATLYVFSDGLFEFETAERRPFGFAALQPLLLAAPEASVGEPERLYRAVRRLAAAAAPPDDDVTLLTVHFDP